MPQSTPSDLPNYEHPDYERMLPHLTILADTYAGLIDVKDRYLPRAQAEPDRAYAMRVENATFNNKVRPTIDSNSGLLTAFECSNLPPSVEAAQDDLDNQGSDFKSFFQEADTLALRDGYCFVLVDFPPLDGEVRTAADAITNPRRPNLSLIDRKNVLNWRSHWSQGAVVIDHIMLQVHQEVPDGAFGVKSEKRYHQMILDGGRVFHRIWAIATVEGRQQAILEAEQPTDLREIPIVCYPCTAKPFNTDTPPFLKIANLNLKLFRKESALDEIEYRVNVPTVWRRSSEPVSSRGPVTFGATWIIELLEDSNGKDEVGVLEIEGTGVAALQQSIDKLKDDIEAESLAFLQGAQVQRTATESYLSSAQVEAGLSGFMRDKQSAIQRIFDYWCAYTGEENAIEFEVDHSLLEMPLDAQEMQQLLALWQSGAISHETLLNLLKMGRQLPPNFEIALELERLMEERSRQSQPQLPGIEDVGAYLEADWQQKTAPVEAVG